MSRYSKIKTRVASFAAALLIASSCPTVLRGEDDFRVSIQGGPTVDLADPSAAAKAAQGQTYTVNIPIGEVLNVRALPDLASEVVVTLGSGRVVEGSAGPADTGDGGSWAAVCNDEGTCGWTNFEHLKAGDGNFWWPPSIPGYQPGGDVIVSGTEGPDDFGDLGELD